MKEKKLIPKRRFKSYQDSWMAYNWSETVDISTNMVDPRKDIYDDLFHVGPGNIESFSGKLLDNVKKVKEENLISGKFHFKSGDIIYGKINPQLAKYTIAEVEGLASADAYILNARNGVSQNFFFTILQSKDFYKYSVSVSSRTGMPKINRNELNQYQYFAPLFKEQQKIGEFFKQLDQMITLEQRKLEKTKALKSAYLAEMFPAEGERVPKRRFAGFTGEWEERRLGNHTKLITKGTTPKNMSQTGNVNFIKIENIVAGQIIPALKISNYEHENYLKRSVLEENDILISIAGTLGRTAIVDSKLLPANTNQALAIIRGYDYETKFLLTALSGPVVTKYIKSNPTIGAQPNLSLEQISNMEVATPNKEEQKLIGEFFEKLDDKINNQQKVLSKLKAMKQAFLQEMFV
ncbi:restriction endonuclease subunit S [Sporosarcina sp. Marseille-Q4943]|uniref:restriction endonuclease subunit S n=1 Tax=Sporosarcina sp. Marseille-Q4943 TaxID=2942204 RepID=UPI00208DA360|nr:restriction endonuclease subunit S [Sporosarcina sp. Marseille-Q4943]